MAETPEDPLSEDRTTRIVRLRDEGFLLWEIAEWFNVTKERVRQILAKAKSRGEGPRPPKHVVTRQATILLRLPPEMRPGSFQRLMARFRIEPVVVKRGRFYWDVETLKKLKLPRCSVCGTPVPLSRYTRSDTCSTKCSTVRRSGTTARLSGPSSSR